MKVYDQVKRLLEDYPNLRNSDKALCFTFWSRQGLVKDSAITYPNYKKAQNPGSITRARRKIQELHPELRATSEQVKRARGQKAMSKGTFIFRERMF